MAVTGQVHRQKSAQGASLVFICVGNDNHVHSVVYGEEGALNVMSPGSVFIDHTTASVDLARELAAAAPEKGGAF